jgi:hypothetical protein
MVMRSIRRLMLVFVAAVMLVMPGVAIANQGSYDTLRVQLDDGTEVLYRVWTTWPQLLLTTPDGGAFAFFTAQAGTIDAPYKLYVARFDPTAAKWSDATAVPGGQIQFGVTGAVDSNGVAHVVFTDRAADAADSFGKLVYMHSNPDGTWTAPVNVNDNADAGHQLAPSMVVDAQNVLHLVWQDQRTVTPELRAASPSNAAILSCDLTADGVCSADPAVISTPSTPTEIANRPRIATDGQRVVATWSVYAGTTDEQLASASQIAWNAKPLGDPNAAWTGQQVMISADSTAIGGRLADLTSDPTGNVVAVYGRRGDFTSLYMSKLAAGQTAWSEPVLLGAGPRGSFPSVAVGKDGTVYVAYNVSGATTVTVAGLTIPAGTNAPTKEVELSVAEFGQKGQPVLSVDNQGRVWVMYLFAPLYSGDLESGQVPNEVRTLRGAAFSTEPAPQDQLVPPPPATPEASTPVASDGTGVGGTEAPAVEGTPSS